MTSKIVTVFIQTPSAELLNSMTKEQLIEVADNYDIVVSVLQRRLKESVRCVVVAGLVDQQVLTTTAAPSEPPAPHALTFEEQKALLVMQRETELDKIRLTQEFEITRCDREQATEIEKIRLTQEVEKIKLDQEQQRIDLLRDGRMPGGQSPTPGLNVEKKIRLVPPFREADVDTFFQLFERVADAHSWSDVERTLLLQCVLTGRAQLAYLWQTVRCMIR